MGGGTLRTQVFATLGATTMSDDKIDPSKKDATISSADDLVKTTNSGDVELSEEQLNRVTGGGKAAKGQQEYLVIKMNDVIIT
jgi:hypothetical protein